MNSFHRIDACGADEAAAWPGAAVYMHPTRCRAPVAPQPARPGRKPRGVFTLHAAALRRAQRQVAAAVIERDRARLIERLCALHRERDFNLGQILSVQESLLSLPPPPAGSPASAAMGSIRYLSEKDATT